MFCLSVHAAWVCGAFGADGMRGEQNNQPLQTNTDTCRCVRGAFSLRRVAHSSWSRHQQTGQSSTPGRHKCPQLLLSSNIFPQPLPLRIICRMSSKSDVNVTLIWTALMLVWGCISKNLFCVCQNVQIRSEFMWFCGVHTTHEKMRSKSHIKKRLDFDYLWWQYSLIASMEQLLIAYSNIYSWKCLKNTPKQPIYLSILFFEQMQTLFPSAFIALPCIPTVSYCFFPTI